MPAEMRPGEGVHTPRPRPTPSPLRVHDVLAAHLDLAENRETFPVAEADQGDLAVLLLVLVDVQHAALELARAQAGVVTRELAAVRGELGTLSRRVKRTEAHLQELVKQARASNATARDQAELLDELVEAVTGDSARPEGDRSNERDRSEGEHEPKDVGDPDDPYDFSDEGDGGLGGAFEDRFEHGGDDVEAAEGSGPPSGGARYNGSAEGNRGIAPERVFPSAIVPGPEPVEVPRPAFDHPVAP